MLIIIEGPDGSGKSTLAAKISSQTGYDVVHRSQPKTQADKDRMLAEYILLISSGRNIILDRSWYSEMVYGQVMRDKSVISTSQMYALEEQLTKTGALIIYCTDDKDVLWERCQVRGEDYITDRETFDSICDKYDKLFFSPHYVPVVTYKCPEVYFT